MRRIYIYAVMFLVALSACDQENKGPVIPGADLDNVYFPEKVIEGLEVSDGNLVVECPIARYLKEDAGTTISVEMELAEEDNGLFQLVNSDFVFEQGVMETAVEISVSDLSALDPFKTYTIKLTLVGENALVFNSNSELKVTKKRVFTPLGKGTFTSEIFGGSWEVDVEGLVGDTQAIYKADFYGDGYMVEVFVDGDEIEVSGQRAWIHGDYGDIYVSGEGSVDGKNLDMDLLHYVPDLGSFGIYNEILTLP
ncbi:hypothetical protein [Carboxylicivirga sp. M1479]|uniref:hypothetical protein n=1 Tax=Carboxylicivirga sp. M1479 TaxID=2594476 RepID=UPI00117896CD|nr:hypothetical protein [Carboxylicivirga sp. M1479]TRX71129.1 hypothetical protein FNN09_07870 [Carboxylicivirga sp. M1479]